MNPTVHIPIPRLGATLLFLAVLFLQSWVQPVLSQQTQSHLDLARKQILQLQEEIRVLEKKVLEGQYQNNVLEEEIWKLKQSLSRLQIEWQSRGNFPPVPPVQDADSLIRQFNRLEADYQKILEENMRLKKMLISHPR